EDGPRAPGARGWLHADIRARAGGTGDPGRPDGHSWFAGAAGQARANPGEIMMTAAMLILAVALGQAPNAKTMRISAPGQVGTIDTGKLKGEPTELAWSPD